MDPKNPTSQNQSEPPNIKKPDVEPVVVMTADEIIAFDDREPFPVLVPHWKNRTCMVRELDVLTLRDIADSSRNEDGKIIEADYSAKVIVEGSVDPKFRIDHIAGLKKKNNQAFTILFNAIMDGKYGKKK